VARRLAHINADASSVSSLVSSGLIEHIHWTAKGKIEHRIGRRLSPEIFSSGNLSLSVLEVTLKASLADLSAYGHNACCERYSLRANERDERELNLLEQMVLAHRLAGQLAYGSVQKEVQWF
jgi:hypothetical protein